MDVSKSLDEVDMISSYFEYKYYDFFLTALDWKDYSMEWNYSEYGGVKVGLLGREIFS